MLCASALIPIKTPASSVSKDPKASLMLEALGSRAQKSAKVQKRDARHILLPRREMRSIDILLIPLHFLLHTSHNHCVCIKNTTPPPLWLFRPKSRTISTMERALQL